MGFPVQISCVIITYNEEKYIARCIRSALTVADEVLVVDSFSNDRTREICLEYGVRFLEHKFEGHMEQKQWAVEQANYDYILSLDADETLSPELEAEIKKIKNNWAYDGYVFNRKNNYCGKWVNHTTWYPDKKMRLFDRRKGAYGGVNPHDIFLLKKGTSQKRIKKDIQHYIYSTYVEHMDKTVMFAKIAAYQLYKKNKKAGSLKLILNPAWRFLHNYIFRLGVLDGYEGYIISRMAGYYAFLKYSGLKSYYKGYGKVNK